MNKHILFKGRDLHIYWSLQWFDKETGFIVGDARLDTLTEDEAFDAFHRDRNDPFAFEGGFNVGPEQAAVLQRHTEHPITLDRYVYQFELTSEPCSLDDGDGAAL